MWCIYSQNNLYFGNVSSVFVQFRILYSMSNTRCYHRTLFRRPMSVTLGLLWNLIITAIQDNVHDVESSIQYHW